MNTKASFTDKDKYPGPIVDFKKHDDFLEIESGNGILLRIYYISDHILRFRYSNIGYFEPDFSYAIDPKYQIGNVDVQISENTDALVIKTAAIECFIIKSSLTIRIYDIDGNILCEDEKGYHWERNEEYGGDIVQYSKIAQNGEAFYGLGDKPTDLNLSGKRFMNWGTDEYGYHKDTDPLYKSIPIYYGLHKHGAYGIFFDNSFRAYFDFKKERKDVVSFWAQGGEMNYYFIAGPTLLEASQRYTLLTGTPDMPPMWALGFQQCKWSYYPESNVREVTSKMRELKIPCDAIYLDIDYMDGFRCFTWDDERFPDPKKMVAELESEGFKTMVIIDPGIKKDKDYKIFQEGLEKGYFCRRIDGAFVEGKVWPGNCYFPDFTKPEVREWWAGLYKELIEDVGIAGVWNDMNEPALFEVESKTFPNDVLHDHDGHLTGHRKAHNIYGMQMARATADGVKKFRNGKRTLIITRSGYSGLQRYSSVWTGDNIASWEHLWLADVQAQRLAISGISFCGSDIGGFIHQPSSELMTRWIQLGIFHPFCRVHSSGDHGDQEPWSFGEECTDLFRQAVELRYQLLPYIYTSFYQYHKEGTPMLRPLVFVDQATEETKDRDYEFLCGDHILVCPVVTEDAKKIKAYLPKGSWYHYWREELFTGNKEYDLKAPINQTPIFVRAGAIIPFYPVQQYVGEKKFDQITLNVYYTDGTETSHLYEDDCDTYEYEKGHSRYTTFSVNGNDSQLKINKTTEGDFVSKIKSYKLNLVGFPFTVNSIEIDGKTLDVQDDIIVDAEFSSLVIKG